MSTATETPTPTPTPKNITIFGPSGIQGASVLHYLLGIHPLSPAHHTPTHSATLYPTIHAISSTLPTTTLPSATAHPNLRLHHIPDPTSPTATTTTLPPILNDTNILFLNLDTHRFLPLGPGHELAAHKRIIDAALAAPSLELLVVSGLPNFKDEALRDQNADAREKSRALEYAFEAGEREKARRGKEGGRDVNVVAVQMGWYFTNLINEMGPAVGGEDGKAQFFIPGARTDVKVPWTSTYTDLGPVLSGLIHHPTPSTYHTRRLTLTGDLLTLTELASIYEAHTHQPSEATTGPLPLLPSSTPLPPPATTDLPALQFHNFKTLLALINAETMVDEYLDNTLAQELFVRSVPERKGLTGWKGWLEGSGFDVSRKGEGYGERISKEMERWGGRRFV